MLRFDKARQAGRYHKDKSKGGFKGSESDLEKQCEGYLDALGIAYIRIPDAVYRAIFGAYNVNPWIKKIISKFLKGLPDITILFTSGEYYCVELKNAKGRQSQGQKTFERMVGSKNYKIIRDFDSFVELVNSYRKGGQDGLHKFPVGSYRC